MAIRGQYDYEPFGATLAASNDLSRTSFIGKEKDRESNLGDFGVWKYDNGMIPFIPTRCFLAGIFSNS